LHRRGCGEGIQEEKAPHPLKDEKGVEIRDELEFEILL
jgi:hypothetical protein